MKIIFEDDNYIAIDKPAGMLVHPDGREESGKKNASAESVTAWLSEKYPKLADVGGSLEVQSGAAVPRWGIVHRIDRETSGVLLVAKNQVAFDDLQNKFQNRKVKKNYKAFVYGRVTVDSDTIEKPIGRSKTDFRRWSTGSDASGTLREAVTTYRVIHKTDEATFIEVMPKTGRTHQIRVHMRSIGNPVICDSLYAPLRKSLLGFKRLALHAHAISFWDINDNQINIEAPYPADFEKAMKTLGVVEQ